MHGNLYKKLLPYGRKLQKYPRLHRGVVLLVNTMGSLWLLPNFLQFYFLSYARRKKFKPISKPFENLETLKDKHNGKRCFIVATGPSLLIEDVEKLTNEITFSMNSIFMMYDKTAFRPTYYSSLDPQWCEEVVTTYNIEFDIVEWAKEGCFFNWATKRKIRRTLASKKTFFIMSSWLGHWLNPHGNKFKFSDDLLTGIYDGYNSVYMIIQIVAYMGCTEIYLIGVDGGYYGDKKHFINNKTDKEQKIQFNTDGVNRGFEFIEDYSKSHGFKVYNATRGGFIEAFERVNLDEVLRND